MSEQLVNAAATHFKALMTATREQLRGMQGTPIGTDPRSPQQEAALWKRLRALPTPEFNQTLDIAASKAGHVMGEEKPCEVCQFVATHAGREAARST